MTTLSKQKKIGLALGLLIFAAIKIVMIFWWQDKQNHLPKTQIQAACNVLTQGCTFLNSATFRLHDVRDNKSPFQIIITGLPENVQSVSASFDMQDMDMGFNRVDLIKQADGSWQATSVYLPFCTAARHDWRVTWLVDGARFQAAFQTQ